jgi:hypothetical protein
MAYEISKSLGLKSAHATAPSNAAVNRMLGVVRLFLSARAVNELDALADTYCAGQPAFAATLRSAARFNQVRAA